MNIDFSDKKELVTALSKLQGELSNPPKNKQAHQYKYATLDGCMDILKPLLTKNELALCQILEYRDNDAYLVTYVSHSSGQSISNPIKLIPSGQSRIPMQDMGAAITYARRYGLCIVGITSEEDTDGAASVNKVNKQQDKQQSRQQRNEGFKWTIPMLKSSVLKMVGGDGSKAKDLWDKSGIEAENASPDLQAWFHKFEDMVNS